MNDKLSPDDTNTVRFLTRDQKVASKAIPKIMRPLLAPMEGEKSMREAFDQMMNGKW